MCFYALAADFAAGAVAPALTIMEFQFVPHTSVSKLSQLVAVSLTRILPNDGPQLTNHS
jgi:hypothetical protein